MSLASEPSKQSKTVTVNALPYKASIIITNYNYARYVEEAIKSVIDQTYLNREIIIVDDGSKDNSVAVIEKAISTIKEPIKFIKKENGGTASARNAAVKAATGDFLCFLDADDFYYPDKVAVSIGKLTEFPGLGIAYSDYDILDVRMGTKRRECKPPFNFNWLLQTCIVSTNSVVAKPVFDAVGLFDESIRGMEDYNFWLRASTRFAFCHIPFSLFCYREHGLNKTRTTSTEAWMAEENTMKQKFLKEMGMIHG